MYGQPQTRRKFLAQSSSVGAGTVLASQLAAVDAAGQPEPKILNHNPQMGYRPLGKTGFMISEIGLGGHGAIPVPTLVDNRVAVLERAVEHGINYVDNNIVEECNLYGEAMAKSSHAKRDKWFIGFASWPQKVTEEYEAQLSPKKMMQSIEDRLGSYRTDTLDLWRPVGATWGKGQKKIATMLMVSRKTLDLVTRVFDKAKQQGKVRFLGISAHNPKVFRRVLNDYPQFHVIIFPYLFLTKEFGGDGLLKLAQSKGVGVIGLKPFGAGTVFGMKPSQLKKEPGKVDRRAHVLVREMLAEPRLSAVIPGVNLPDYLDENVKGSFERHKPQSKKDEQTLRDCTENFYANITPEYHWLRQWVHV